MAATDIICPIEASSDSLEGLEEMLKIWREVQSTGHPIHFTGAFFNKVPPSESVPKAIISAMREICGIDQILFKGQVGRSSYAERCRSIGTVPCIYDPFSQYSKDLVNIMIETQERIAKLEAEGE